MQSSGSQDNPETDPDSGIAPSEQWVDRYGDSLFRYAMAKTGCVAISEELVQETFLAAISAKGRFRNESSVSTWLFAILKRKVADNYRRKSRREFDNEDGHDNEGFLRKQSHLHQWDGDPARLYEDQEFWKTFDQCVEKLPNKLAEVFILREVNQNSPKEICELLGLGATNLSMRLHRCRLALRECLNQNWFHEESE